MTISAGSQTLSRKARWLTKVVAVLTAGRWMIAGALTLVVIEQRRRGVFTTDDAVGLMLLWLVLHLAENSIRRRLSNSHADNSDA